MYTAAVGTSFVSLVPLLSGATRLFVVRNLGLYGILLLFCLRQVALLPAVHGLRVVQKVQLVQLREGLLCWGSLRLELKTPRTRLHNFEEHLVQLPKQEFGI